MVKLAANLSMLFNEYEFLDRFEMAARSGFQGVEYTFPYEYPIDDLKHALSEAKVSQVLHKLPPGNWSSGDRGIACDPSRQSEFHDSVEATIEYATALNCQIVNCLAGLTPEGFSSEEINQTLIENLRYAGEKLRSAGIQLLAEPINNKVDIPGFYLTTTEQALSIFNSVGDGLVELQYDAYHMQIMEGNLVNTVRENLQRIKHIQIADTPGRHEPGTGEVNYDFFLSFLDEIGYTGWVGAEYRPLNNTESGLTWSKKWL